VNQDLLTQAKQRLSLSALMAQLGFGDHATKSARCPFHEDSSASFSFYVGDDGDERWKCFAGCGHGDAIDYLAKHRGLSNADACREFIRLANVTPPPAPPSSSNSSPWVALDPDTKLVPCWFVSSRDAGAANHFMHDLAGRLAHRVQLTTDGHKPYLTAVEDAFGADIDYAQLVKIYGAERAGEARYSPAQCMGARKAVVSGSPDRAHISTSHTERQNLTMRMQMRRFTRLTNAFSKKIENHEAAVALHYMHYNFARVHQTLRVTPAMEAGFQIMSGRWKKLLDYSPPKIL
jgi:IS1 family transposase